MELLHTGGIVSTEVEVKQTDDLRAWLRKRERERRQSKPQWKSDGQVATSDHGSPALGRSTLIEPTPSQVKQPADAQRLTHSGRSARC